MAAAASPRKSVNDLLALPPETRAELIDGVLSMTPAPFWRHQQVVSGLCELLGAWVRRRRAGVVCVAPMDVHLPSGDVVQPDLLFLSPERSGLVDRWVYGVPDLLIEVLSGDDPRRDRVVKRDLYAGNGVPEYWLVDPEAGTVEVLRLESGAYRSAGRYVAADTLSSATFPGLALRLRDLFGS